MAMWIIERGALAVLSLPTTAPFGPPLSPLWANSHSLLNLILLWKHQKMHPPTPNPPTPHPPTPHPPTPNPSPIPLPLTRDLRLGDDALLYIAYVMLIWAAPIPANRWRCSLWP